MKPSRRLSGIILLLIAAGLILPRFQAYGAPRTVKIGLIAPFEGLYRASGYEVLFAVKLALQERNRSEGLQGYRVELVALNDFNDPVEAVKQARALVADPAIVGVIGHLTPATTAAAVPIYQEAGLALAIPWSVDSSLMEGDNSGVVSVAATVDEAEQHLAAIRQAQGVERVVTLTTPELEPISNEVQALELDTEAVTAGTIILALQQEGITLPLFGQVEAGNVQLSQVAGAAANGLIFVSPAPGADQLSEGPAFVEAYRALSGLPPGPRAVLAYEATNILLDSIEQAIINRVESLFKPPGRQEVGEFLPTVRRFGITGEIVFDRYGRRLNAPVWIYQISEINYPGILIGP